jgi:lipopolysaccharide export system permease protein
MLISEYISPKTDQWAQSYRDYLLWGGSSGYSASTMGLWHREGKDILHINVVQPGGVLYGVTRFDLDDQRHLQQILLAERAIWQDDHWYLEDVVVTEFSTDQIKRSELPFMIWKSGLSPQMLSNLALPAEDLALQRLYRYAKYLADQGLDSGDYQLAFWQRVFHPLAIVGLVLVAMSFVFGPLRESTAGYRVFIGIIVGIVFQFAQNLLGPASLIYNFPPIVAVLVPIGICIVFGLALLGRAR